MDTDVNMTESMATIKERLGETNRAIGVYKPTWEFIKKNVFVMTLDIQRYRGTTRLDREDLGIEDAFDDQLNGAMRNYARLGTKRILPVEIVKKLDAIGATSRNILKNYSYKMPFGSAHLITEKGYVEFKKEIEPLRSEFFAVRDYLYNEYDAVIRKVGEEYRTIAQAAWLTKNPGYTLQDAPQSHVDHFVSQIVSLIPPKEEIRDSFYFDWEMDYVNFSLIERSADNAAGVSAAKKEIADRIQRSTVDKVESTINLFSKQINDLLYDVATNTLMGLERGGAKNGFKGRTMEGLKNWVKQIRALNFFDMEEAGREIDRMIGDIEEILGDTERGPSGQVNDIAPVLQQIRAFSTEAIVEMTGSARRTRKEDADPDILPPGESLLRRRATSDTETLFASPDEIDSTPVRRGMSIEGSDFDENETEVKDLALV